VKRPPALTTTSSSRQGIRKEFGGPLVAVKHNVELSRVPRGKGDLADRPRTAAGKKNDVSFKHAHRPS